MTVYANVGHILLKRGNTVQSTAYTGPVGEVTYDTDLKTLRVHDGSTVGGNIILINSNSVSSLSSTGNLCLTANTAGVSQQWTLGANGNLTFPDSTVQPTAWTGSVSSLVNGASNVSISTANGVPTITRAPYISGPQSFPAQTWTFGAGPIGTALGVPGYIQGTSQTGFVSADNWGLAIDSGNTPASISLGQQDGNNNLTKFFWGSGSKNGIAGDVEIQTINSSGTPTSIILSPQGGQNGSFIFGGTGNLSVPGSILFTSSPAGVISGASSINTGILYATGNITGGNILSNNYLYANGVNILSTITPSSSYSNTNVASYLTTATITTTGNVTAGEFIGDGSGLTRVALKTSGSWTVTTGTNTYSFTVPASGTYQLWVDCNIPSGILAYNATATITNNNVPVVGAQYAWVYNGGGSPIDFTSIPNQFTGTGNTIVRSSVAPSATTNRFDFGLNNTSGGNVTVRYGWIQIG